MVERFNGLPHGGNPLFQWFNDSTVQWLHGSMDFHMGKNHWLNGFLAQWVNGFPYAQQPLA